MDVSPIVGAVWSQIWWLLPVMLVATLLRSAQFKGWLGERLVRLLARWRLPAELYQPLHDVTLMTDDGTTQIDHLFVSPFGIFVVETKNMGGWIFGSEKQARWTQRFHRKSVSFQNPLRQNYKHVKAVEAVTGLPIEVIHSVVVFVGSSRFKTTMPANVTQGGGCISYIKSFKTGVLTAAQVQAAVTAIRTGRLAPTLATHREHVRQLKERIQSEAEKQCPACGSKMVLRTAAKGAKAGNRFWGCSAYPKCRSVQQLD